MESTRVILPNSYPNQQRPAYSYKTSAKKVFLSGLTQLHPVLPPLAPNSGKTRCNFPKGDARGPCVSPNRMSSKVQGFAEMPRTNTLDIRLKGGKLLTCPYI